VEMAVARAANRMVELKIGGVTAGGLREEAELRVLAG